MAIEKLHEAKPQFQVDPCNFKNKIARSLRTIFAGHPGQQVNSFNLYR